MKRLTMRNSDGTVSQPYGVTVEEVFYRLAEYEDKGREPNEILSGKELAEVACALISLKEYKSLGTIDHIRALLKAEQDGRLVVLPCKVGDTVYHIDQIGMKSYAVKSIIEPCFYTEEKETCERGEDFYLRDFGKTVFLSREESDTTLAGKEVNEDA